MKLPGVSVFLTGQHRTCSNSSKPHWHRHHKHLPCDISRDGQHQTTWKYPQASAS